MGIDWRHVAIAVLVLGSVGCLSNEGCDLEIHQNWSCAHGGKGTVINPAVK